MSSLYGSKYGDRYEQNKYIWENEKDKNSETAQNAHRENAEIRKSLGINADTMDYDSFRNARANHSDYYAMANSVSVDPRYKQQSDRLYDAMNNFKYDAENDPAYLAYSKAVKRESDSAQKSAYANMTKASGGRNNSYAAAATAQVAQAYGQKAGEYANTLAEKQYEKLATRYQDSVAQEKQAQEAAEKQRNYYKSLGDADVANKTSALADERAAQKHNADMRKDALEYKVLLNDYEAQLIKNNILNEKNMYEFEMWKKDPNYEIKDKKLAETIGKYMGYSWLKQNARDFLYSKFYN